MSAAGVRSTRQRAAISTLLETLDDFRSAQENCTTNCAGAARTSV